MGLFKDLRGASKDMKNLRETAGVERMGIRDGLQQARGAMADAQTHMENQQHLQGSGTQSSAVILAVRPTQTLVNHMPVIEYDLRVDTSSGEVDVTHAQPTPQAYLGQLVPGATVDVLVDPSDPHKIALVFA